MVSGSVARGADDSQEDDLAFTANLEYIRRQHSNRTEAAPTGSAALFVAEFGLAQNHVSWARLAHAVTNVVERSLAFGVAHVLFWQTYCNECTNLTQPGCAAGKLASRGRAQAGAAGRCHDPLHPVTDPASLNGFWLRRPDGSFSWPYRYLAGKIQSSRSSRT